MSYDKSRLTIEAMSSERVISPAFLLVMVRNAMKEGLPR
jgi:hypothetical protein